MRGLPLVSLELFLHFGKLYGRLRFQIQLKFTYGNYAMTFSLLVYFAVSLWSRRCRCMWPKGCPFAKAVLFSSLLTSKQGYTTLLVLGSYQVCILFGVLVKDPAVVDRLAGSHLLDYLKAQPFSIAKPISSSRWLPPSSKS